MLRCVDDDAVTGSEAVEVYVFINDIPAGTIVELCRVLPELAARDGC